MNFRTLLPLTALLVAGVAQAETLKFTVGNHKPAQIAQAESVTDVETFSARTTDVTGTISFDPTTHKGGGKLVIAASTLKTGIDLRDEHLQSSMWLDTKQFPEITFETTKVKYVSGNSYKVTGNLTLHGVTKPVTTTVKLDYRKASDVTAARGFKGDVINLKTSFKVKLSDYGITIAGPATGKVSNDVTISVTALGASGE